MNIHYTSIQPIHSKITQNHYETVCSEVTSCLLLKKKWEHACSHTHRFPQAQGWEFRSRGHVHPRFTAVAAPNRS